MTLANLFILYFNQYTHFCVGSEFLTAKSFGFDFQRTFLEVCPGEGFEPETEYQAIINKSHVPYQPANVTAFD